MPYGDGTGPAGLGPMTGRVAGFCAGFARPGYAARQHRPGFPGGRGYRNWFHATGLTGGQRAAVGLPAWGGRVFTSQAVAPQAVDPYYEAPKEEQLKMLKTQQENLKAMLEQINKQIEDLEQRSND